MALTDPIDRVDCMGVNWRRRTIRDAVVLEIGRDRARRVSMMMLILQDKKCNNLLLIEIINRKSNHITLEVPLEFYVDPTRR
jgi:hypothetical protein